VQCWARVVLAKAASNNEGRKSHATRHFSPRRPCHTTLATGVQSPISARYRLLALYQHIEAKCATKIQIAFRNRQSFTMSIADSVAAGVAARAVAAGAAMARGVEDAGEAPAALSVQMMALNDIKAGLLEYNVGDGGDEREEVVPLSKPATVSEARDAGVFNIAPSPISKLEGKVHEIKVNHAATVMQKLHRDASKAETCQKLQGHLFKRSGSIPLFQRRYLYVSPDSQFLCYREGKHNEETRIPFASISAIALESEVHYEFSVDSTARGKKLLFRAATRSQLELWLNGLADLAP